MANVKISDLTAMPTTDVATGDILVINDISEALPADQTKKIALSSLFAWQNYTPVIAYSGGTTDPTTTTITAAKYYRIGGIVHVDIVLTITRGSGDRTTILFALPVTASPAIAVGCGHENVVQAGSTPRAVRILNSGAGQMLMNNSMTQDGLARMAITYSA